jgi:hypothetical protein
MATMAEHDPATVGLVASVLRTYVGDCDWTQHAGRAVLDALTAAGKLADAAHDARVRAQAGEDAARAAGDLRLRAAYGDDEWISRDEVVRVVRQVTGAEGEVVDGG